MIFCIGKYPLGPLHILLRRGARRGKTHTLMYIIQNMLQYYIKQITNVDPLKPKVIKQTCIGKTMFNTIGTIIHS